MNLFSYLSYFDLRGFSLLLTNLFWFSLLGDCHSMCTIMITNSDFLNMLGKDEKQCWVLGALQLSIEHILLITYYHLDLKWNKNTNMKDLIRCKNILKKHIQQINEHLILYVCYVNFVFSKQQTSQSCHDFQYYE